MRTQHRRGLLFGFTVVAAVLALTSAAWACTVFKGKLTLQGNASTSTVTATGNNSGMGFCSITNSYAYSNGSGGSVKVTVGPASSTCGGHKLPATGSETNLAYKVTYVDYGFYNSSLNRDCMYNGGHSTRIVLGDITVDSNGNGGGGWYSIPGSHPAQNGSPYEAGVCVSDTKYGPSLYGIQAPLVIL